MTLDLSNVPGPKGGRAQVDKPSAILAVCFKPSVLAVAHPVVPQWPVFSLSQTSTVSELCVVPRLPLFRFPPEIENVGEAISAWVEGDKQPLLALVEERVGRKPDSLLGTCLNNALVHGEKLPFPYLFALLKHHRRRLEKDKGARAEQRPQEVRGSIHGFGSLRQALSGSGYSYEETLKRELPGAIYLEQERLPEGANIVNAVTNRLRREGPKTYKEPEVSHGPGRTFSKVNLDWDKNRPRVKRPTDLDAPEIAAFIEIESMRRTALSKEAGLSLQEWESFVLGVLLGNNEAGRVLGRSANQIGVEKSRAIAKLRKIA